ncbi:hypothetical protein ERJ75_000455800 [Trypanosoma vivax]|nr:hypothetical protein ERJ75_000455800 [Trypanosoma vivax]
MWQRILVSVGVIALVAGKARGANNFAEADMKGVCTGAKTLREAGSAASYVVEEMQKESERLTAILGQLWLVTGAAQAASNDTVAERQRRKLRRWRKSLRRCAEPRTRLRHSAPPQLRFRRACTNSWLWQAP